MKKTNLLVLIATIATLGFFSTSCKKDATGPRISILTVNGTEITKSTGDTVKVTLDSTVTIKWSVTAGTKAPTSLVITQNAITVKTQTNADSIASGKYSTTLSTAGNVLFSVSVTDKNDSVIQKTFVVKVAAPAAAIKTYSATLLYAPLASGAQKCALATSTGSTYNQADAKANASTIDILYFYGSSATYALGCPADALTTAYNDLSTWSVQNTTTFVTTSANFASITTSADILAAYNNGTYANNGTGANKAARIYNLSTNQVVGFKTAAGKYGILQVTNETGTDGTGAYIQIDVKVQQ